MIRLSILFLSIFSLIYGIYFLIFPYSFVNLTVAENTNIAWLRNLGGAITGLLFIGLFSYDEVQKKKDNILWLPPVQFAF